MGELRGEEGAAFYVAASVRAPAEEVRQGSLVSFAPRRRKKRSTLFDFIFFSSSFSAFCASQSAKGPQRPRPSVSSRRRACKLPGRRASGSASSRKKKKKKNWSDERAAAAATDVAHFPPQQQQQDQQHHHHHQQHTFQRETVVTKQEEEEEEEEVELLLTHFIFRRRLRIIFHTRADAQTNTHTQERVTHHDQALTCHDWQVAGGPPPSPSPSRPNQSAAGGDGIVGTATIGDDSAWVY